MEKVFFTFQATKSNLIAVVFAALLVLAGTIGVSWEAGYESGKKEALQDAKVHITQMVEIWQNSYVSDEPEEPRPRE